MNSPVSKTINGHTVHAKPVFKGGQMPAYWCGIVNERTLAKTFTSPTAVFQFVTEQNRIPASI